MAPKEWRKASEIEADLLAAAARANDPLSQEAAATIHSLAYAVRAVAKGERLTKRAVAIADCRQKNAHKREAYDAARNMGRRLDAMQAKMDVYRRALNVYEREIVRLTQSQPQSQPQAQAQTETQTETQFEAGAQSPRTAAAPTPTFDALASNNSNA